MLTPPKNKKGGLNGLYNGRPGYEHESGKFFLYYNSASQGFWAVGERLGSEVVRLENQAQWSKIKDFIRKLLGKTELFFSSEYGL